MSGDPLPEPNSCLCNLHRVGDQREPRPEPTELCRNSLGVFSMTDCPLTVGIACAYYEASPVPHPTTSDAGLEAARDEMQRDFLGWRYRRRVRWLTKPKNVVPAGIVLDAQPEPEEVVPETLAMRPLPPDAAPPPVAPAADATATSSTGEPITTSITPAAPSAPERYPGQRRSEERLAKKRARLAALDAAAAAKAAQIAAVAANPPADDGFGDDLEEDGDEFEDGEDSEDTIEPVDTGPKTVEQVLAALPDAPVVLNEPRRQGGHRGGGGGGGGGGGPPREGGPRRRRRRGRRGGGGGPGGGSGQGAGGGGPRPQGPRGGGQGRGQRPGGGGGGGPPRGPRPPQQG